MITLTCTSRGFRGPHTGTQQKRQVSRLKTLSGLQNRETTPFCTRFSLFRVAWKHQALLTTITLLDDRVSSLSLPEKQMLHPRCEREKPEGRRPKDRSDDKGVDPELPGNPKRPRPQLPQGRGTLETAWVASVRKRGGGPRTHWTVLSRTQVAGRREARSPSVFGQLAGFPKPPEVGPATCHPWTSDVHIRG